MTLPASGTIALSNVNTEIGSAATTARDLAWVKANTKDSVSNLGALYSRSYYKKNNAGNCNNGNCWNCYSNCGDIQCNCGGQIQCGIAACRCTGGNNCYAINCANCDTKNYIQADCNCACTYNCTACYNCFTYNCNCACDCNCACK